MLAKQIFGSIILVGAFVMLLLYMLTSQMISAAIMVRSVDRVPIIPTALPVWSSPATTTAIPQTQQPMQQHSDDWRVDFEYTENDRLYKISRNRTIDDSQEWHSCNNNLAEMLLTLPEVVAWHIRVFCTEKR